MTSIPQPGHFTPPKRHRFLFLDALRGLAALFITAFHLPSSIRPMPLSNGLLAVDFFFCLSGFVIAFSYEKRLAETLSFIGFAIARWIRLYPIYLLGSIFGLLTGIVIHHISTTASRVPGNWFALSVMAIFMWPARLSTVPSSVNFPLDIPAWSLFYEIIANLAYALFVKFRAAHSVVFLGIAVFSLAILATSVLHGSSVDVGNLTATTAMGFARVAFSFVAGVLIYRLYRSTAHIASPLISHWIVPCAVTIGLAAILASPLKAMRTEWFRLFAIGICFPALVYCGAVARLPHRFARASAVLGELSYPLYLLHLPFLILLDTSHASLLANAHPAIAHAALYVILGISAFLAWWVGEHIDLPLRRFLTRSLLTAKPLSTQPAVALERAP